MIIGCYTLNLYCDTPGCQLSLEKRYSGQPVPQYTGETYGECARKARVDGWQLSADRQVATCPACCNQRHRDMSKALEDAGQDW
jgi:hypothetical protein